MRSPVASETRQPKRSATMPASVRPAIPPIVLEVNTKPTIRARSRNGNRSATVAIMLGRITAAPRPARARVTASHSNVGASAATRVSDPSPSVPPARNQPRPKRSESGPATRPMRMPGVAYAAAARPTDPGLTPNSVAIGVTSAPSTVPE